MLLMTFEAAHYLLSFGGTIPGGETWSTSLRLTGANPGTEAVQTALCDEFDDVIATYITTAAINSPRVVHTWTKLNWINADGKYFFPFTSRTDTPAGNQGTGSATFFPNQISLVATLTTDVARGRACRGRMFLPAPGISLDTDGRLTTGNQNAINTSLQTFLNAINGVALLHKVHIISSVGTGASHIVQQVGVGRVYDTMRSRRASLLEERVMVGLTPPP